MPRRVLEAILLLFVFSGCLGAEAFATGRPTTERDYRPIGPRERGLELAGSDTALAAFFDMAVARDHGLGPILEAAVVADAGEGREAIRAALLEAESVWVFVTPRPSELVDVVFVLEGTSGESVCEYASAQRSNQFPRTENGVVEYVVGELQVAIRAPDTLVLGNSRDGRDHHGAVWDWTDWADRLRGISRAEPKPELTALRDALGAADAPMWAVLRWTAEVDALAQRQIAEPAIADSEQLLSRIASLGFSAIPLDQGLRLRGIVRGRDPDLATTLTAALTRDMPELAALLPGLQTCAEGSDLYAEFTLSPEALARLIASRFTR